MEKIIVQGGASLQGRVTVSGAKNAVLPIITAALLADEPCRLFDVPDLADVDTICEVLRNLGARVERGQEKEIIVAAQVLNGNEPPYDAVRKMRASFLVMGPLLARTGQARISLPGGCAIGIRPIDLHLKGFQALGARISFNHGSVVAEADGLVGNKVYLDFPSVGATENIMMAAALAKGQTIIENAAEEPEIVDLANFINAMGGNVKGAGTNVIRIEGVERLHAANHTVIPDRIEAGSFMVAAAICGGDLLVENVIVDHLKPVVAKLKEAGALITEEGNGVRVIGGDKLRAIDIKTLPYPGFPTDMQAQFMALATVARGTSVFTETVFENRFMHVNELKRMGASIKIEGRSAIVEGVPGLAGARVKATDLRAGAALIIAALVAEGETEINCIYHIDRGYDDLVGKLRPLGVKIWREDRPE